MGEAKRRKQKGLNYGKKKKSVIAEIALMDGNYRKPKEKSVIAEIAFLDCCEDIIDLLDSYEGRERAIALAIVDRYGINSVNGKLMNNYHYVDAAIKAKRNDDLDESIYYYNMFFRESTVGKSWFMAYYGAGKTLAIAGDYSRALTAIKISMELASITGCADANYVYERHYKSILALKQGIALPGYLEEIQG